MQMLRFFAVIRSTADAWIFHNQLCISDGGGEIKLVLPDRTPRDKLQAIAKAINDALSAARELEGLGRD